MSKGKLYRQRIEISMPEAILKSVEEYQMQNGLSTRNAAILELIRKGLNLKVGEEK